MKMNSAKTLLERATALLEHHETPGPQGMPPEVLSGFLIDLIDSLEVSSRLDGKGFWLMNDPVEGANRFSLSLNQRQVKTVKGENLAEVIREAFPKK